jgi:hypothetical protein
MPSPEADSRAAAVMQALCRFPECPFLSFAAGDKDGRQIRRELIPPATPFITLLFRLTA